MNIILRVNHVTKKNGAKNIINDITFQAKSGEIIALVGPNGAGKSTLLKLISGLLKPDKGTIIYKEIDINSGGFPKGDIGYLIEAPFLYPYLSAEEMLNICLKLHDLESSPHYKLIMDDLNIKSFKKTKVKHFSMGMKQRLGIACSFIHDPKLVLLDEPTNSLDINGIRSIKNIILQLKKWIKL